MGKRAAIETMAPEDRQQLERKLVANGFSDYEALAQWLQALGYEIHKSQVHRFGQSFQERLKRIKTATEQAKMLQDELGDDEGALNDALIRHVQAQLFELLEKIDLDPDEIDIHKLIRNIAQLSTATVRQKQWAAEARDRVARAAEKVRAIGKSNGLSDDALSQIEGELNLF
tara:strand:+ start:60 stop:575 length:516 start_codon:yes stop_codon:yes gene_type:complete